MVVRIPNSWFKSSIIPHFLDKSVALQSLAFNGFKFTTFQDSNYAYDFSVHWSGVRGFVLLFVEGDIRLRLFYDEMERGIPTVPNPQYSYVTFNATDQSMSHAFKYDDSHFKTTPHFVLSPGIFVFRFSCPVIAQGFVEAYERSLHFNEKSLNWSVQCKTDDTWCVSQTRKKSFMYDDHIRFSVDFPNKYIARYFEAIMRDKCSRPIWKVHAVDDLYSISTGDKGGCNFPEASSLCFR